MQGDGLGLRLRFDGRLSVGVPVGRPARGLEDEASVETSALRKITGRARIERMQRVSAMVSMRLQGRTLQEIGDAQNPPITFQAVSKAIRTVLHDVVAEPIEAIRSVESLRLDQMLAAVWPRAKDGDLQAISAVLQIMARRARLLGLDQQPGSALRFSPDGRFVEVDADPPVLRVEIVGTEVERGEVVGAGETRLLAHVGDGAEVEDPPTRMN